VKIAPLTLLIIAACAFMFGILAQGFYSDVIRCMAR